MGVFPFAGKMGELYAELPVGETREPFAAVRGPVS